MKLIFTDYPFSKQEAFIYGLENQDAVNEFLGLFNLTVKEKNNRCQFTDEAELQLIIKHIKSNELKNVLTKYVGKEILVLPENDDYKLPDEIHYA